jgi:hypothetical protein
MGNGASGEAGAFAEGQDNPAVDDNDVRKTQSSSAEPAKFRHENALATSPSSSAKATGSAPSNAGSSSSAPSPPPPPAAAQPVRLPDDLHASYAASDSDSDDDDQGQNLAQELFELLPYCNIGDSHTDGLVLKSLANDDVDYLTVDDKGNTLLMIACQYRLTQACKIMIEHGVNVNTKNIMGAAPLHFAVADGTESLEVADLLLRHGAKVNSVETSTGCTPLHYAALVSDSDFVQLLLRAGADPLAKDHEEYIPLNYANDVYQSENVVLLTSAGTAKRHGMTAYDAFLDNLKMSASQNSFARSGGGGGGGGGGGTAAEGTDNEIDNLLSELNMDRHGGGFNNSQQQATETELRDVLVQVLQKEGVGAVATSSKQSLQRSTTVRTFIRHSNARIIIICVRWLFVCLID